MVHFLYAGLLDSPDCVITRAKSRSLLELGGMTAPSSILTWQIEDKKVGDSFLSTCPERWDEQEEQDQPAQPGLECCVSNPAPTLSRPPLPPP